MKDELIQAAKKAKGNAYAPFSGYAVGAAVLSEAGVSSGCNVENASYGLTVCAERNAIAAMVLAGGKRIMACAVATCDGKPPCGACLQVLAEFATNAQDCAIYLASDNGEVSERKLSELMPSAFRL